MDSTDNRHADDSRSQGRGFIRRTITRARTYVSFREVVFVTNVVGFFWIGSDLGDRLPSWESVTPGIDFLAATVNVLGRPLIMSAVTLLAYVPIKQLVVRGSRQIRA